VVETVKIHVHAGTLVWNESKGENVFLTHCFEVLAETDGQTCFKFFYEGEQFEVSINVANVLSYEGN